jgi:hypothetical protein
MEKIKILIGSPIRQDSDILKEFLYFLEKIDAYGLDINYFFIDDNTEAKSSDLLHNFSKKHKSRVFLIKSDTKNDIYLKDENTHYWSSDLVQKVANFKNKIISFSVENNYDYLFLVDSDILLQPPTIKHLINTGKDIISEVFWTKWQQNGVELPQVWLSGEYNFFESKYITRSALERKKRMLKFLKRLKKKGIYEVGGLGACTLISKRALKAGVSFSPIYNLPYYGEDRHFSIRAVALGFRLYASTFYPPLHLYRKSDLSKVNKFREKVLENLENRNDENISLYYSKK